MSEPRCWICQAADSDKYPLVQLEPSVPSLACTRHLPAIDLTDQDNGAYEI